MKTILKAFLDAVKTDFRRWKQSIRDPKRVRGFFLRLAIFLGVLLLMGLTMVLSLSGAIVNRTSERVSSHTEIDALASENGTYDCILVLGCGVKPDGTPSDRLRDRVKVGVSLYHAGIAPKLLMSGDHGREGYDEVSAMLKLAVELGVPKEDIFLDHAGFSTYESIYRAKDIFSCKSILIVSQDYHLYRALYIAESFGIEARGVSADLVPYVKMVYHNIRETLARCKDFFFALKKPAPTYLGDPIDLTGDGSVTHE